MRILFLTSAYLPDGVGGIEMLLLQACRLLRERGHAIEIITSEAGGPDQVEGVPVHRLNLIQAIQARDPRALFAVDRRLREVLQSFQPSVVHSHDMGPQLWFYQRTPQATASQRPPLVVSIHNVMTQHLQLHHLKPIAFSRMGRLLESADRITAVSLSCLHDTLEYAPSIADRLEHLPNGIQPPPYPSGDPDPDQLLCVGRLVSQKGFDRAIEAMVAIRAQRPAARLLVAGVGPDARSLQAQAVQLRLQDAIHFLGLQDEDSVRQLMAGSALVLMPSRYEGLPLVALEAAWAGRPVVASDCAGLNEAVLADVTGVLVPEGDVPALARAAVAVLEDRSLAARLGAAARARAELVYSLERYVRDCETIYGSFCASSP
jgi:glycogen(starch) synthase